MLEDVEIEVKDLFDPGEVEGVASGPQHEDVAGDSEWEAPNRLHQTKEMLVGDSVWGGLVFCPPVSSVLDWQECNHPLEQEQSGEGLAPHSDSVFCMKQRACMMCTSSEHWSTA